MTSGKAGGLPILIIISARWQA